jgi:nitrate reductase gamma subunit
MEEEASDHDTPFSGYATDGISDSRWSTAVAGILGVAVTFAVFGGLALMLRRRTSSEPRE